MLHIIYLFFILFTWSANADCDFKSAEHIEALTMPSSIQLIDIKVNKSKKFYRNGLKMLSTDSPTISPVHKKKKFKSKITVHYEFGKCTFNSTIRQNGDLRDHIEYSFEKGAIIQSLNVKLKAGNILNAIKFKLLIPRTRNDLNEVLTTIILKELGFIAPETFKVNVNINGVAGEMLFQESGNKELLESNLRREGPMFEGDETLLWSEYGRLGFDDISLTRQTNPNWYLKGLNSARISINAYKKLQKSYLVRQDYISRLRYLIQPNKIHKNIFDSFHFSLLALNASHGLAFHNRHFYFNVFLNEFEPVYYDGNASFTKIPEIPNFNNIPEDLLSSFKIDYKYPHIERLKSSAFTEKIISKFSIRSNLSVSTSSEFVKQNLPIFISNVEVLQKTLDTLERPQNFTDLKSLDYDKFIERVKNSGIEQNHVVNIGLNATNALITGLDGISSNVSHEQVANLISEASLKKERAVLIDNNIKLSTLARYLPKVIGGSYMASKDISFSINEEKKSITVRQKKSDGWILFIDAQLDNWSIYFTGLEPDVQSKETNLQRMNEYGLTGCLNFYNSEFNQTNLFSKNGQCEDSINIVNSQGNFKKIKIENAFADAFDADFSAIDVDFIEIESAGNDCYDVSGGNYHISKFISGHCGDKGISVGEKSKFAADEIKITDTNIGISSKDFSTVRINNAQLKSVLMCYQANQKKQEFGGAGLYIRTLNCKGGSFVDSNSTAEIGE